LDLSRLAIHDRAAADVFHDLVVLWPALEILIQAI